jgi:hemoglobin/transferrin/lactoferrin receptor protein
VSDIDANGVVDRVGTSDNLDFTPWVLDDNGDVSYIGSTGWAIFNVYTKWQFNEKLSLNVAVENIFDKFYVPFSSSIAAPGRNVIISLNGTF